MQAENIDRTTEREAAGRGTAEQPPVRETKVAARQAVAPNQVRYMLGFGIAAVVVGFIIVYFLVA